MEEKTLRLGIKAPFLMQILRGFKHTEYREKKPYYDGLLAEGVCAERPIDAEGWQKCLDGSWRKFKPWSRIRLECEGMGWGEWEVASMDAAAFHYLIRLGPLVGKDFPMQEGKEKG